MNLMETRGPWKVLTSEVKYRNPWITVREHQVIRPDGAPGIYGVIEGKVAVGTLALTDKYELYLVGQYRFPVQEYSWEIVEGAAEPDEDPLFGAKRELSEETGLVASCWRQLGAEIQLSNCISSEIARLYVATDLREGHRHPEGCEVLQVRKLPFREALAMVRSGEIKDAMSIMGILLLAREFNL
jgi:ADP-ribose pyrophosphatase